MIQWSQYKHTKDEWQMQLQLNNIAKYFGEKPVLNSISLHVDAGRAFGLLGRNGAGKTTTIRILMNVFPPTSGNVTLDGNPIDYAKTKFGYLPEERGLYPKKTIVEQLTYFAMLKGMDKAAAVASVDKWLARLDMSAYRDKRLDTLSKGNQQKIQLITALTHDPDVVILDEPFSGLDPVNAMLLKDVVRETIDKGKIVLFSSHQMNYIEEFCDDIAILAEGKIALQGDLNQIKRSYPRNKLVVRTQQTEQLLQSESCTRIADDTVLVAADDVTETMRRLTQTYALDEIRVFEPSLNDIFVQYTDTEATK